jgi:hypothetical protein
MMTNPNPAESASNSLRKLHSEWTKKNQELFSNYPLYLAQQILKNEHNIETMVCDGELRPINK